MASALTDEKQGFRSVVATAVKGWWIIA